MDNSPNYSNNSKYFWAAITILTLLSGGLGYLYLQEKKLNTLKVIKIEEQVKAQLIATTKLDSMSSELTLKINEVKNLGGDVSSLKKIKIDLEADKRQIINQKNIISSDFDKKIKNYEVLLAQKDLDIMKLRELNGILVSQNKSLNTENSGLKSEKLRMADSINSVAAKNKELADKVTLASALRAQTINVYAISSKGKELDGGSYNARKVDKIRISFHLVDNPLSKQEEKEIFVRLLDPNGSIISDTATGSGTFLFNGQEIIFSAKKRERYTNSNQLVEILYARGQSYRQGKYGVELYCEGYKIGQGTFDVK